MKPAGNKDASKKSPAKKRQSTPKKRVTSKGYVASKNRSEYQSMRSAKLAAREAAAARASMEAEASKAIDPEPRSVVAEKPVYGGAMLAHLEGKAVFVPLALEGESLTVRLTDEKKSFATAEILSVDKASRKRITPRCPHFARCGGCDYQHTSYAHQLEIKREILTETLTRAGLTLPGKIATIAAASEAESWQYRSRIRLAMDFAGEPGYRERASHKIVAIDQCPIAAPVLVRAALLIGEAALEEGYHLAEMALFCTPGEESLAISLQVAKEDRFRLEDFADLLAERIPELRAAELLLSPGERESLPLMVERWGEPSLLYPAAGAEYRVDHGAFFQVNRHLVEPMVKAVIGAGCLAGKPQGDLAWDLYAGVGLFARQLARGYKKVVAVESAGASRKALKANLEGLSAEAVAADTLEFLADFKSGRDPRPERIVVDPPRTGMGPKVTTELIRIRAPRITSVSCDPATLARDLKALCGAGYRVDRVTLLDLFPHTFHLETVVELSLS